MGLHQTHAASDDITREEAQERFKVFRSLYLRDKSCSISRGSICWLPSFDCSLSSEFAEVGSADSSCAARIQLAKLQEDIYRLFHSAESQRQSPAKHKSSLSRIEQNLERWAKTYEIFSSLSTNARDVDLQLEFLAARTSAFYGSSEPAYIRQALNDSRASCLLLLIFYGKHDQSMIERCELLFSKRSTKSTGQTPGSRSHKSNQKSTSNTEREEKGESASPCFHSLLDTFSVPGFFLLVKNIIWPLSASDGSQIEEDIDLLQRVCVCYKELITRYNTKNHTHKVGRAFETLLEVINFIKNSQTLQRSMPGTHQNSNTQVPPTTQNLFSGPPDLSDYNDLPVSSTYSMSSLSWDSFMTKNNSTATKDTPSTVASPGLRTPIDSLHLGQVYEPLQQQSFPSHFQQQTQSATGRKRPRMSEPDVSLDDYPDSGSLFDFLTANPNFMLQDEMPTAIF